MIRLFLIALSFLTRVPVKLSGDVSESEVSNASAYFGVIGLLIGVVQGLVFWALFPTTPLIAAVGSTIVAVLVTGAFHHDGLADAADALVGGWTPEQRREILKDSRLGTYGVMALVLIVLFEVALIAGLEPVGAVAGLVAAHTVSRTAAVLLAAFSSERGSGLGGTMSRGVSYRLMVTGLITAIVVLACWFGASSARSVDPLLAGLIGVSGLGVLAVVVMLLGKYAKIKVGAVTGDALGAAERISFNAFLLMWVGLHTG